MGAPGLKKATFDVAQFQLEFTRLVNRHGLLAIVAHVLVPLDAANHHVFEAEAGVDRLAIDQVKIARRHPDELLAVRISKGPA